MKELKTVGEIIQQHFPSSTRRGTKRWVTAERRKNYNPHHKQNQATETDYHRVIELAKSFMQDGETYFERDYKHDQTEGLFGMHCFMTSTFYWRLDCKFTYDYCITLVFNNCPYEAQVRAYLRVYPLDRTVSERNLKAEFDDKFKATLNVQEPRYVHSFLKR